LLKQRSSNQFQVNGEKGKKVKMFLCLTTYLAMNMYPHVNQAPHHEDIWGSGGIAPHILNLRTRWKLVVSFKP
jgi:hypothetical protein